MSPECNTLYKFGSTDAYNYIQRKSNKISCAMPPKCSEYLLNTTKL